MTPKKWDEFNAKRNFKPYGITDSNGYRNYYDPRLAKPDAAPSGLRETEVTSVTPINDKDKTLYLHGYGGKKLIDETNTPEIANQPTSKWQGIYATYGDRGWGGKNMYHQYSNNGKIEYRDLNNNVVENPNLSGLQFHAAPDYVAPKTEVPALNSGGSIDIKPSHKGRFTEWAERHGMSVSEAANMIMANKDNYDTHTIEMANFAKNARGFQHKAVGGNINDPDANNEESERVQTSNLAKSILNKNGTQPQWDNGYKGGGSVSPEKAKEILHDGAVHGHPLTDKQRRFFGYESSLGKKYAKGGEPKDSDPITKLLQLKKQIDEQDAANRLRLQNEERKKDAENKSAHKNWVNSQQDLYLKNKKQELDNLIKAATENNPNYISSGGEERRLRAINKAISAAQEYNKLSGNVNGNYGNSLNRSNQSKFASPNLAYLGYPNYYTATNSGKNKETNETDVPASQAQNTDNGVLPSITMSKLAEIYKNQPVNKSTNYTSKAPAKTTSNLADKLAFRPSDIKYNPEDENVVVPSNYVSPTNSSVPSNYIAPSNSSQPTLQNNQPTNGAADKQNNMDWGSLFGSGLGLGQSIAGIVGLSGSHRPTDTYDPVFESQLANSLAMAKYGYSPQQQAFLNQKALENRNKELSNIYNMAGGNGSVALNNARGAFRDYNDQRMKNAYDDEMLRFQKQNNANQMASEHYGMHRRLFDDQMNKFMQNQQAYGNLLNTGLSNVLDSGMYRDNWLRQAQIDKINAGQ